MHVTPKALDNCAHNFSRPFSALRVSLRGSAFYAVLREEMEIISRTEPFDFVTAYF